MSRIILFVLLSVFIVNISADLCLYDNLPGKVCGTYPWTFCCQGNTQCGTNESRICYSKINEPPLTGIIFAAVVGLIIFLMILKACITCCSPRNNYDSIPSSDPAYLSRSGAVVCTAAASRC